MRRPGKLAKARGTYEQIKGKLQEELKKLKGGKTIKRKNKLKRGRK